MTAANTRYNQLDSLRGLAALSVLVHHCLLLHGPLDGTPLLWTLTHTPAAIVSSGRGAVILFFVLSGFVLSLPFLKGPVPYPAFIAKRICRIYVPYGAAIVLAMLLAHRLSRGGIPELGPWFNMTWTHPLTPGLFLQHLLLIGSFANATFNTAIWSLVHEMRVSIAFPLVVLLVQRCRWQVALTVAGVTSLLGIALTGLAHRVWHSSADYFLTVHFAGAFIVGALLALHRVALARWFARRSRAGKAGLLLAGACVYTVQLWFSWPAALPGWDYLCDWFPAAASALFIIAAISSDRLADVLMLKPLHFLGKISFSLYLLHGTVLFSLVHLLYGRAPMSAIWGLTLVGSLALAAAAYYVVEIPSIRLGHAWASRLQPVPRAVRTSAEAL